MKGIEMDALGNNSVEKLRSLIERVENLQQEKANIVRDMKEVFDEAKSDGFCTKTIKKVLKLRSQDDNKRAEEEAILDTYRSALGI